MNVKEIRQRLSLTQKQLAEKCGVKERTVQKWEAGGVIPAATQLLLENFISEHESDTSQEPKMSYEHGVPYYNVDFIGGFDLVINDQTINPDYLIDFPLYRKATCWCNITGHSMEPEITHGDIIALRKIEDWRFLPYGEVYAIVTKNDMRTVKRIGPSPNPNCIMLIPTNKSPEYAPQELKIEDILHVFEVMGCMKKL